jgi:acetate---CoA ligase (ADP-forming)
MTGPRVPTDPMRLEPLMAPRSIAVVGASPRPGTYGNQALANLVAAGYSGRLYGVHPSADRVHGVTCVRGLAQLPEPVDAVVIATPAATVPALVDEAGTLGCRSAVVFAAGFAETPAGRSLQDDLIAASHRHDLPVCGPNGNGIIALKHRAILWGDAFHPRPAGNVGLISQSGNVAVNAIATRRALQLHTVVSCGNQAVLDAADYLAYLANADGMSSVALYLEDDGDGAKLAQSLASCVEQGVSVAVLKAGQSALGRSAAAAHTGAVAGDARVLRALVEEAGGAWARNPHELLELAKALSIRKRAHRATAAAADSAPGSKPMPPSVAGGIAVVTCSGGDAACAADEAERLGVYFPPLSAHTRSRLVALLPETAAIANPLDYTAVLWGKADSIAEVVRVVGEDPAIDRILVYYDRPLGMDAAMSAEWDATLAGVMAGAADVSVPVLVASTLPELLDEPSAMRLLDAGIAPVAGLSTGLVCAGALGAKPGSVQRLTEIAAAASRANSPWKPPRNPPQARQPGRWLAEHEAKSLLRANGIPVPAGVVVDSADEAVAAARRIGFPVVLKLSSPGLLHKTELGALALDLTDEDDVLAAFARLRRLPGHSSTAVLVESMAEPGIEILIAARREGVVPTVVVGLGGTWVEVLNDVAVVPLPARAGSIESAMADLAGARLLHGDRGGRAIDIAAVARIAAQVAALLLDRDLDLIELNPVVAADQGAVTVDAVARERAPTAAAAQGGVSCRPLASPAARRPGRAGFASSSGRGSHR